MDIALFDFDGTITVEDTFPAFVKRAIRPEKLRSAGMWLTPHKVLNKLGLVSDDALRARYIRLAFSGRNANNLWNNGERFAQRYLKDHLQPRAMDRIRWHRERGDRVVVVSEGLDVYLRTWCDQHGVELLCNELEEHNSKITGRLKNPYCAGAEKARRIREHIDLSAYDTVWAYGDSKSDTPMLNLSDEAHLRWKPYTKTVA